MSFAADLSLLKTIAGGKVDDTPSLETSTMTSVGPVDEEEEEEEQLVAGEDDIDEESDEEKAPSEKSIALIKRWFKRRQFRRAVESTVYINRKRKTLLNAFLEGEKLYFKCFEELERDFRIPLRQKNLLDSAELAEVFGMMDLVRDKTKDFLEKSSAESSNRVAFAETILSFCGVWNDVFDNYCMQVTNALTLLYKLIESRKELNDFFGEVNEKIEVLVLLYNNPLARMESWKAFLTEFANLSYLGPVDFPLIQKSHEEIEKLCSKLDKDAKLMDSNLKKNFLRQFSEMVPTYEEHALNEKQTKRPRVCKACHKAIWGLFGAKSICLCCLHCSEYFHTKCNEAAMNGKNCERMKPVDLEGDIVYSERVFLIREGGDHWESLLLCTKDGFFLSKISWSSLQAAKALNYMSPANVSFELILKKSWDSVDKCELQLPPPGQVLKQYIFNLGMVKIGRPDRKECEAIFNRVQKIWKENSK